MTILIADQNRGFRTAVKRLLEVDNKPSTVWETDNGETAVELARELHPDLVLVDISLPGMSGLEATRMIKRIEANIQVIIMGEYTEQGYRLAAIRSGADAFLPKSNLWTTGIAPLSIENGNR
jgi:DNA-binding NarL/FixJ family response regulator